MVFLNKRDVGDGSKFTNDSSFRVILMARWTFELRPRLQDTGLLLVPDYLVESGMQIVLFSFCLHDSGPYATRKAEVITKQEMKFVKCLAPYLF